MQPERDAFESLLESVADGTEVDWAALDSSASTSAERTRYRNLRLVARVAELHRTLVIDEGQRDESLPALRVESPPKDPRTWGQLSITSRVASGAFGQIYRAHDPGLNRDVALKLLRGDIATLRPVERLLGEARTLAQVHHPNVVTVHGADVRDGRAGLWMELVEGQTLDAWASTLGPMGPGETTAIGIDLCRALAAVHAAGLVHGDVKAQNVMRETGGRIVLMDFGAGRAQGADVAGVAGTPMYLAPEVLAGEPPTTQSDLYSLGVVLFYLLTRSYPCVGADLESLRAAHADGDRRWLRDLRPDVPSDLVQVIERSLESDPARRFTSAGEMEWALHRAARPAPVPVPVVRQSVGLRFAATAAALLIVIVSLVTWSRNVGRPAGSEAIKSIAVLAMVDLSGAADRSAIVDGLHDDLITTLGEINSLRVVSRTSVLQFKNTQLASSAIAKTLGVDAVLESTLSYVESGLGGTPRVHVNTRLMLAGQDVALWSRSFERPLGELRPLQAEGARAVTTSLGVPLTSTDSERLNHSTQMNPAAEEAYFQGKQQVERYGRERARLALEAFERATRLDPQHARAYAGTAMAYFSLGYNNARSEERRVGK